MRIKTLLAGAALMLASATASASLITIDDFSTDQGPLVATAGNSNFSFVTSLLGDILGGERDLRITNVVDANGRGTLVEVTNGNLFLSSGSGVESQFTIQWDGVDGSMDVNPFGLGGVNFFDGVASFVTTIIESDLNAFFEVTFWSGDQGTMETQALPIPGVEAPGRDAFFTTGLFTNTDFSNIGAIQVVGNTISPETGTRVRSYDLQLDGVTAVPEPGTMAIFALGIAGLMFSRRIV